MWQIFWVRNYSDSADQKAGRIGFTFNAIPLGIDLQHAIGSQRLQSWMGDVELRINYMYAAFCLSAAVCTTSAYAADPEIVAAPTEMEYSVAAQTIDPVISNLKTSKFQEAVDLAFAANPLVNNMKSQISVLVGQITTVSEIYGPIRQCELAERSHLGSLMIRLTYVCQHESYLTRWHFKIARIAQGNTIMSMDFADAN